MTDVNAAAVGTLAMTQAVTAYTFFLPKITDVRKTSLGDNEMVADIRTGEIAAFVVSLGVGMVCSALSGSSLPAAISLLMAVIITALYESVLRKEPASTPIGA